MFFLHNSLMNILQTIFKDHYEEILYILHPRQSVIDNVDKMINCGAPAFGGAMYACSKCDNLKFVPFRCKSRFYPTCGVKYCQDRSGAMALKLIHCTHRHCVFTIDEELRHFNYTLLRKSFQTALLNKMEKHIGPSFKKTKALIYKKDSNGFYVYAKPNLYDTRTVIKYISRYPGCPVIALSRIDFYNGENVTFHYNRHEDNVFVKKTIPAPDFISLLIQHIPEPHYKMTGYYGLYAGHRDNDKKLRKAIHPSKHKFILSYSKWRNNIAASFGYGPLCCSKCKATMTLTGLYFKHRRVSLEEMYERSMAKILQKE